MLLELGVRSAAAMGHDVSFDDCRVLDGKSWRQMASVMAWCPIGDVFPRQVVESDAHFFRFCQLERGMPVVGAFQEEAGYIVCTARSMPFFFATFQPLHPDVMSVTRQLEWSPVRTAISTSECVRGSSCFCSSCCFEI